MTVEVGSKEWAEDTTDLLVSVGARVSDHDVELAQITDVLVKMTQIMLELKNRVLRMEERVLRMEGAVNERA